MEISNNLIISIKYYASIEITKMNLVLMDILDIIIWKLMIG